MATSTTRVYFQDIALDVSLELISADASIETLVSNATEILSTMDEDANIETLVDSDVEI